MMKKRQSAFTLIELMLVIAIMATLATVLVTSIRSMQRQARATLCQTHLKNLHQGVMNYFADNQYYPAAGSFEYEDKTYDVPRYWVLPGWITWIKGSEEDDDDKVGNGTKSIASRYKYVGCGEEDDPDDVRRSIEGGALFKYVGKDFSAYFCKQFNGGVKAGRRYCSYAMNNWFGSRTCILSRNRNTADTAFIEASRMVLFVEKDSAHGTGGATGHCGGKAASTGLGDDSSFDADCGELYGTWHRKGNKTFGHVVFLDGHVESLVKDNDRSKISKRLGKGTY